MPAYLKIGDIKGESTDSFHFKGVQKGGGKEPGHDSWIDVGATDWGKVDSQNRASSDPLPSEDFTFNYEKIEWTYDEGMGYTASDDLFL